MMDDALERVLSGLRTVEKPAGLEGRVLRRLAERRERRSGVWALGVGLAAAIVLVGVLGLRFGGFKQGEGVHTPGAKARMLSKDEQRPKAEALGYLQATTTADSSASLRQDNQRGVASSHVSESRHGAPGSLVFRAAEMRDVTLAGVAESFPAPPQPLTEQERLLVRVARHPRAAEVEFLIAEVREAALVKGNADFDLFFKPTEVPQPMEVKENTNEVQPIVR